MKFLLLSCAFLLVANVYSKTLKNDAEEANAVEEEVHNEVEVEDNTVDAGYAAIPEDPCAKKHCRQGRVCDVDEEGIAICVCMHKCPEWDNQAKVCSTQNVTFESECELHRQKCLCHKDRPECQDRHYKKAHLDYYGECKEMRPCEDYEMEDYPLRMRDWFYLVMEELAQRADLNDAEEAMVREAEEHSKKWVLPVIWKFCDLDKSHDRLVSPHELLPISAPLKPLEHCTGPFLHKCDADSSGYISLEEWGVCLGLDPEEIQDRCDGLKN